MLKEILEYKTSGDLTFNKDTELIWVIFSGNDLKNLAYEKITMLHRYIDDYNINYFENLKLSNIEFNKFFEEILNDPFNNKNIGQKGWWTLNTESIEAKIALIDFERVFDEIKEIRKIILT